MIEAVRGSGKGGQAKQKTSSCIIATHRPTNTRVRIESDRSQYHNKVLAIGILEARIKSTNSANSKQAENNNRREQLNGVKRRTARIQHGVVVDHLTGQRWNWNDYFDGKWD
jgi:protein subunit release factor A